MKKLFYFALILNIFLVPFQYLNAESFADVDDSFSVISPLPNSKVGGNINIEWNSFDDDQSAIPYYIELLDGATCKTNSYGRINTNSASNSSKTTNNKLSWDTHKTLSNQNLADGSYCLQICSAYKNNDMYYSLCNARNITIVNINKLPTITSVPNPLTINENESWQYQVKASDTDNDNLKYYLVYAPDFLQINATTGLVSTKENAKRLSDEINIAEYRVVIGVDDGISGTTTQEFTIRIERGRADNPSTPTTPEPTEPETPEEPEAPENTPSQISFIHPTENEVFKGIQNFVEWSIYDPDEVKSITLSYSLDLENWTEIISKEEDSFSRYSWDVTSLVDDNYYLQLKVTDKKDETVAKVSKQFNIKNIEIDPVELKPIIINLRPENTKVLTESVTTISGDFAPAEGEQINPDSFKLSINDIDVSNRCVKNEAGFQCTLEEALSIGNYTLKAEISDINEHTGSIESTFSIEEKASTPTTETNSNSNTITIVIIVGLLLLILVGLPWFLIGYSKRKIKKSKNQVSTQPPVPTNYAYPQAVVTLPENNLQTPQPPKQTTLPSAPQTTGANDFSSFMSEYNFNQEKVPNKVIGQVKEQKNTKKNINETFKEISNKVSTFVTKPEAKQQSESTPIQPASISQNIQSAYTGGTSTQSKQVEEFVEPTVIDEIDQEGAVAPTDTTSSDSQYVTPKAPDDEELKRMYPELYGTGMLTSEINKTTQNNDVNDDYFEPVPKD